ncbi:hypothetical protein [Hyalangium gracile]|uniref:hypothetical protein n=1 Tax=Hyalangium gracile TaxID=394092 RepID=UPI001CCFAD44|nr:hypothetical protein [Hyalangium gracile]
MSIHRPLMALATFIVFGLCPEIAFAERVNRDQPMWFSYASEDAATFGSQYTEEVFLDMCSWTSRPNNASCTVQSLDTPWSNESAISCGPPTGAAPSNSWFKYTASQVCVVDPYTGCRTQRWEWPDGRMLSGSGNHVLTCPSDSANMGTGLFSKVLVSTVPHHVFMRLPGFFSHIRPQYVRGQVVLSAIANPPYSPSGLPSKPMSFILALQHLTANGQWQDLATREFWAQSSTGGYEKALYEVGAWVSPNTSVRVELRANVVPPLRVANENNFYENYSLMIDLVDARLVLPVCIPDMSNPGQCLLF